MIAFDNGPPNGDYVRYIDRLMVRAANAVSAEVLARNDVAVPTGASALDRAATPERRPVSEPGYRTETGFAPTAPASAKALAAASIASALMSGQVAGRRELPTYLKVGFAAIAIGIVVVLAGFFWSPVSPILLIGGVALIVWALRMMKDASARSTSLRISNGP